MILIFFKELSRPSNYVEKTIVFLIKLSNLRSRVVGLCYFSIVYIWMFLACYSQAESLPMQHDTRSDDKDGI